MKKLFVCFVVVLISAVGAFADQEHVEERVKDAGVVLKEVLDIPDDIPQDLLDKAECVVILPSVKKVVYGIDIKRVMRSKLVLGIADGWLSADGSIIYRAFDLKVGLFRDVAALQPAS